ncbi:MAG: AI-2E family transporter [Gemmataceae bacterium]
MSVSNPKLEWQRGIATLAALALVVVIVTALYWARSIFIPVALAVFFTFVLSPVVSWLEKRGLGRLPAVVGSVAVAVLAATLIGGVIAWQLGGLMDTLPERSKDIAAKLTDLKRRVAGDGESRFGKAFEDISAVFIPRAKDREAGAQVVIAQPPGSNWYAEVSSYVSPALELVGQAAFGFILAVFMLLKKEDLRNRLIRLTGDTRVTTTTKAVDDASRRISRYLLTQLVLNAAFGVVITVAMFALGDRYAILWGALAAVMRYVPYLGTWLGLLPPVLVSLAAPGGEVQAFKVLVLYGGLELICNNVFEPWLYGSSMGLSEVAQLVAAAFWAFLWGPVGLILSGPLTVCLLVLGKYVPRFEFLDVLLGDEPALGPDVRVYQRLAARDQDEAEQVAREELKRSTLEEVYDGVLIPALGYARRDVEQHTLDRDDLESILRDAREIADELADSRLVPAGATDTGDAPPVRILAVPARDDMDQLTLEMLGGLMADGRWEVKVVSDDTLGSEVLTKASQFEPAAIVIGSLPPGGLAHTRYLCKRLRKHFPDVKILVGRWGQSDDEQESRDQLVEAGAAFVTTSLAQMKQHLAGWASVLAAPAATDRGNGKVLVGTRTA